MPNTIFESLSMVDLVSGLKLAVSAPWIQYLQFAGSFVYKRTESTGECILTERITVTEEGINKPISVSRMNKTNKPAMATFMKRIILKYCKVAGIFLNVLFKETVKLS